MKRKDPFVVFLPSGKRGHVEFNTSILSAARQLNVDLDSVCGTRGICSKCQISPIFGYFPKFKVKSDTNSISPSNEVEERYERKRGLITGRRLGCQAKIRGDLIVDVPPESQIHKQVVRKEAEHRQIRMSPATKLYYVEVQKPDLELSSGDYERLKDAIANQWDLAPIEADLSVIKRIQQTLRAGDWKVTCAVFKNHKAKTYKLIEIWPGYFEGPIYGIAVDLGSTTIAGHFCNLLDGSLKYSSGLMNPQIKFGEDLMSRVSYAMMNLSGTKDMTEAVIDSLNELLKVMSKNANVPLGLVLEMVIVGNPIMHHILLGIDPSELGQAPFALSINESIILPCSELGIKLNESANTYILPCIAGHVGADASAVVLSEGLKRKRSTTLVVDVGTNAEIILCHEKEILACSSPTGPAFEGAQISDGQRAAPGAIEKVRIDKTDKTVKFKVIGCDVWSDDESFPAKIKSIGITGICGSGIIEAVAEMRMAGIVDSNGLIGTAEQTNSDRCILQGRTQSFVLYRGNSSSNSLTITNSDIRAIQLAKAALYAGARLLMDQVNIDKVDSIILAGAFGANISPLHAMVLGMIPDCDISKVSSAGNAAGTGSRIALLNKESRLEIEKTVSRITKIETALANRFQEHFVSASNIPNSVHSFPNLNNMVALPNVNFNSRSRRRSN
ncbi:MAG: ASKHA domain-containing protein [Pseudomonadota bacterium]|nr:ASKHA domain-containing protein [Pseudomonadota bacterium]